jgi:hypothetical protein
MSSVSPYEVGVFEDELRDCLPLMLLLDEGNEVAKVPHKDAFERLPILV